MILTDEKGNVTANGDGEASFAIEVTNMTLTGEDSIIGKGFIVHEQRDDGVSQPTGGAGNRFAQCVIGIKKTAEDNEAHSSSNSWATCEVRGVTDKGIYGRVNFEHLASGEVRVHAKVCGMKIGSEHGFHVHQFGDLSGDTRATNLGTHFNPHSMDHGLPPSATRHLGDMVFSQLKNLTFQRVILLLVMMQLLQ